MIRNTIALFLVLMLILAGCESPMSNDFHTVKGGEDFQLSLPVNLKPTQGLHDLATLQAEDKTNGFFLLGIKENKQDLKEMRLRYQLRDYAWFVERQLMEGIDTLSVDRLPVTEINGLKAERFAFTGLQTGPNGLMEIWMRACVIEGPDAFYQIVAWTQSDRSHWMTAVMDKVECSFKEVPSTPEEGKPQQGGAESAVI